MVIDEQFDEQMSDLDALINSDREERDATKIKSGRQLLYVSEVRRAVSSKDDSPLVILSLFGAEEDNKRVSHDHFLNFPKGSDNVSKFKRMKSIEFMEGLFGKVSSTEGLQKLDEICASRKVFKARVSIDARGGRTFVNIDTEGLVGDSAPDGGPPPF